MDYKAERLDVNAARKRIAKIVRENSQGVIFSNHAKKEMENDDLTIVDIWNVLKSSDAKLLDEGELERGSYRYRLETNFITVVVSFSRDGNKLFIVTAWDNRT